MIEDVYILKSSSNWLVLTNLVNHQRRQSSDASFRQVDLVQSNSMATEIYLL
jgi:hypothetical protein